MLSHCLFQAPHPLSGRFDVVHVKQGDEFRVYLASIIAVCSYYIKDLFGPRLFSMDEVIRARHDFFNVAGCIVEDPA